MSGTTASGVPRPFHDVSGTILGSLTGLLGGHCRHRFLWYPWADVGEVGRLAMGHSGAGDGHATAISRAG